MKLAEAVDSYLILKRSLGAVFSAEARILRCFSRALGDVTLDVIDEEAVHAFCRGTGPPTRWWERKHYTLRDFFAYLVSRAHMSGSPIADLAPHIPRSFEPYIYSHEELQRLLDATEILDNYRFPLQQTTFRTLLLVLYGEGLRPSEGLRLRCCDVEFDERVLAIWDTKFFKSRLVPIGAALSEALRTYYKVRQDLPMPTDVRSSFFASRTGAAISLDRLEKVFVRLREHTGIRRPPGARWQPRLHDLRHAFAVHRLVA